MADGARESAVLACHLALGARMGNFAGWKVPLEYGTGSTREHQAVRESAGVFDVSHLGTVRVSGATAVSQCDRILTNDHAGQPVGRARYTLLLNEHGGIVDDLIAYRLQQRPTEPEQVVLVANAVNAAAVVRCLRQAASAQGSDAPAVTVADEQGRTAVIAVQGPESSGVLSRLGLPAQLGERQCAMAEVAGMEALIARTGYTGEHGYEILLPSAAAPSLWSAIVQAGAVPAGLIARDTLRTEMGYPLFGQDIGPETTPMESGLSWAVAWQKEEFIGRAALLAGRAEPRSELIGLRMVERGIPRPGMRVYQGDDAIGQVTSGTYSPSLGCGIALARIATGRVPLTGMPMASTFDSTAMHLAVDIRGRRLECLPVHPPFIARRPR